MLCLMRHSRIDSQGIGRDREPGEMVVIDQRVYIKTHLIRMNNLLDHFIVQLLFGFAV